MVAKPHKGICAGDFSLAVLIWRGKLKSGKAGQGKAGLGVAWHGRAGVFTSSGILSEVKDGLS